MHEHGLGVQYSSLIEQLAPALDPISGGHGIFFGA